MWDPIKEQQREVEDGPGELCEFVNRMSKVDSADGTPIVLKKSEDENVAKGVLLKMQ